MKAGRGGTGGEEARDSALVETWGRALYEIGTSEAMRVLSWRWRVRSMGSSAHAGFCLFFCLCFEVNQARTLCREMKSRVLQQVATPPLPPSAFRVEGERAAVLDDPSSMSNHVLDD